MSRYTLLQKYILSVSFPKRSSSSKTFPKNEKFLQYKKGSEERKALENALDCTANRCEDIPIVIGGEEIRTDQVYYQVMPHLHSHRIAKFHYADKELIEKAIEVAVKTQEKWDRTSLSERTKVWEHAANLMSGKYRQELLAVTMLGQAKTVYQAEIDAAAELADFLRVHLFYANEYTKYQPVSEDPSVTKNSYRYRGIDGFIAAISPFNFTAIGGNLATTPALMGNAVLWKPSDTAILSNWRVFNIMREAGLPDGVINFIPSDGPTFGDTITCSPHLAGINFTGSDDTFSHLWKQVGDNIENYRNFPRLSGECGGKNFHFIHESAEVETVIAQTIRSAFEYSGQKCSACSRMFVPEKLWSKIKSDFVEKVKNLELGDVQVFSTFTSAVIDEKAYCRIKSYIEHAKECDNLEIIVGGTCCNAEGYFVQPTVVVTKDPHDILMEEEIFGPVLTVYVYKESELNEAMNIVAQSKYGLTGAVFAKDKEFLECAFDRFKMVAGNYYINDKSTGAVVGQQPFGGGRRSGTNDKPGGPDYCLRWTTAQSIKETFVPLTEINYPYMCE